MEKKIDSGESKTPEGEPDLFKRVIEAAPPPRVRNKKSVVNNLEAQNVVAMQEARQELKEKELVSKILNQAGMKLHAWFPGEIAPKHIDGYDSLLSGIISYRGDPVRSEENEAKKQFGLASSLDLDNGMRSHKINELIDIRYLTTNEYETVTIKGKKGFLGIGKVPDRTERRLTGRHNKILHSDVAKNGKEEPAINFLYEAAGEGYRDANGRHGKALKASFILPESTAKELQEALDLNPALMRVLVEKSVTEKILKDPSDWQKSIGKGGTMRPPWEKWDSAPEGSGVYIQKEGEPAGFHEANVRHIKK